MELLENRIQHYLQQRKDNHLYRQLKLNEGLIDFSSNDYLGLSRSAFIKQQVENDLKNYKFHSSGATGSRLLNGNSELCEEVEQLLAKTHKAEAALLFNSGFDANVGLISTVARTGDTIFYDELVHASIHQGMRVSGATLVTYLHNNMLDLADKLKINSPSGVRFIITESIFSMEGDRPDLKEIACLAKIYKANLLVDEAHTTGLYGSNGGGLCNELDIEKSCFARVFTFGKALGSHGAVVVGSNQLKEYLVNFSKGFIYTTGLEMHNLLSVKHRYLYLQSNINQSVNLKKLNQYFYERIQQLKLSLKICGEGPIFGIIVPDKIKCSKMATYLQNNGFDVRSILSPTVPVKTERLRIILHSFNTTEQINQLLKLVIDYQ